MTKPKPSTPPSVVRPPRRSAMKAPPVNVMKPAPVPRIPNPRRPRLVRDVDGGYLRDLFAIFPDLPFPRYPAARVPARTARGWGR